jgi:hypothetical protein
MADATVTAEMRMDNKQFLEASKASTQQMNLIKRQSADLSREIAGANSVSTGLAQIMSGNLSAGFAAVSTGLNGLAPKVIALLGPIGLVVAAFTAAYQAGKKLDSVIGISDKIAARFDRTGETDELAKQTAIWRARRQGIHSAAKLEDESAQMAEKRLKGVAKLDADFARESAEIRKQISEATNDDVRAALQNRLDMMTTFHAQDVAATRQAEAEKLAAVKAAEDAKAKAAQMASESRTKSLKDENERMRIAMLEGVNKVQAQFEKTIADINAQIEAAESPEQKAILEDRKVMVSEQRQRDLDALEPAAEVAAEVAEQRRVSLPRRADSMASVGGFLGGERTGLPIQQKQERLQQENNQALKTNATAIQQLTTQVEQLASAMTGGVV